MRNRASGAGTNGNGGKIHQKGKLRGWGYKTPSSLLLQDTGPKRSMSSNAKNKEENVMAEE